MPHCHTFIEHLRQRGYRITPQREMIIEAIAHSGRHMTAEDVSHIIRTRTRSVNLATVYRTLDFLVKEGLASRLDLGSGQVVYATAKHGPHIHLVCRQCGCVIDIDQCEIASLCQHMEQYVQAQYNFTVDLNHFSLPGLCATCREHEEQSKQQEMSDTSDE
jgi:Fur family ferric uptake transcriptional regulator